MQGRRGGGGWEADVDIVRVVGGASDVVVELGIFDDDVVTVDDVDCVCCLLVCSILASKMVLRISWADKCANTATSPSVHVVVAIASPSSWNSVANSDGSNTFFNFSARSCIAIASDVDVSHNEAPVST